MDNMARRSSIETSRINLIPMQRFKCFQLFANLGVALLGRRLERLKDFEREGIDAIFRDVVAQAEIERAR